jgi:acetyltransferase
LVGPADWHKTDRGGVILNLQNAMALKAAARKLKKDNQKMIGTASAYLAVQPQVSSGREMIIGFKRDESFGPLTLVGQGGIYTEIAKDLKITTGDLNQARALSLIKRLNIYPVLNGFRGQKKYNIAALARALVNLSHLAKDHPEIKEFDINPLFITDRGISAGDVRIII